jgi:hypothetical protein
LGQSGETSFTKEISSDLFQKTSPWIELFGDGVGTPYIAREEIPP